MSTPQSSLALLGNAASLAQDIARRVSRGELRPGDRLPSERVLSEQFGISRQSVRKAVRALSDAGVVRIKSARGAASGSFIHSSLVPLDLIDPERDLPSFGDVAEVLEARRLFEPPVALFASIRMDNRDYVAINEVLELQRNTTDLHSFRSLDTRFHLAIADATHNAIVHKQMRQLMQELEIARHVVPVHSPEQEIQETLDVHEQTLEAISSRDPERITVVMCRHLSMMEHAWERASGRKLPRQSQTLSFALRDDA